MISDRIWTNRLLRHLLYVEPSPAPFSGWHILKTEHLFARYQVRFGKSVQSQHLTKRGACKTLRKAELDIYALASTKPPIYQPDGSRLKTL